MDRLNKVDRRSFVTTSALAGAGVMLGSRRMPALASPPTHLPSAFSAPAIGAARFPEGFLQDFGLWYGRVAVTGRL